MESADDINIASKSLRKAASFVWRSTAGVEVFSKSSREEEDDEEALKWAALEKLPTFKRLQKGLLTTSTGESATEVDIEDLGFHERKKLLERLVKTAEDDNERFLLKLKNRIDRVGIEIPAIEVRFQHLNIEAEAHVGSRALPTFFNFTMNIVGRGFLNNLHILPSRKRKVSILKDVSGIIKPSRMTLLLGPPSSGKTTLLLALARKLDPNLKFSGNVTYNGHGMDEFVPQRTAAYVSQYDLHLAELTVRETLTFAARFQGVGHRLVKEFSEAFHVGRRIGKELATPFDKSKSHPPALTTSKYGVGKMELLKTCFSRELLLIRRNSFVYIFKLTQLTIMAMVTMTLFLPTELHRNSVADGGIYVGALFFTVAFMMFNSIPETSMKISRLPVFYKQRDLQFYPPWAFSLPGWVLKIPIQLLQTAVWECLTYYVIGYDPNVGRFFRQYLLLSVISQMNSSLFRFIASVARSMIVANTFGSFVLLSFFTLGGFVLSRDSVKSWLKWGYWVSPLMYGQNAIVINEFLGKSWSHVLANSKESLGVQVLKSRGFFTNAYWYWMINKSDRFD